MDNKTFKATDNLQPAMIITEHIKRIMESMTVDDYIMNVDKLEDCLVTEFDTKYNDEQITIEAEVDKLDIPKPLNLNKEAYSQFTEYENIKKHQFRKRLLFRSLIKLAKRKDLWITDTATAEIHHDKKKVTTMAKK